MTYETTLNCKNIYFKQFCQRHDRDRIAMFNLEKAAAADSGDRNGDGALYLYFRKRGIFTNTQK